MCRKGTIRTIKVAWAVACLGLVCEIAMAQSPPAWRKLGNQSVGLNLAGPAGGPVQSVWFSPAGDRLYARTASGQVFETADYGAWTLAKNPSAPLSDPEAKKQVSEGRTYELGQDLQASDDNGVTYFSLTAFHGASIIGPNQHALAISPADPKQIVVANDFGVWRSADAGLSWSSLNEDLPNLPMRKLLPRGSSGAIRAVVGGVGAVELPPAAAAAHTNWIPAPAVEESGTAEKNRATESLGVEITAFATTSSTWFAGAADGRLWTSLDKGASWTPQDPAGGRIEAIATGGDADAASPQSALMVVDPSRIMRTFDNGVSWQDVTSNLPGGVIHGIAVDTAAGVAYLAGDMGVFAARVDMKSSAPVNSWQLVGGLPEARAMDVRLDSTRGMLYVALDGYGLYAAPAPYKTAAIQVLTAAEEPARAAAPGVLLHVEGSGLSQVKSESGELAVLSSTTASAQVQVPFEATGPTLALTVVSSQGDSRTALPLREVAPAILVDGDGLPIVVDAASGLTLDARNMAHPGTRIQVFASGLGKVDPEWRTGVPAPEDPPAVVARVNARLNDAPVEVTRATLAPGYVGLYLVEVQLPGLVNAGAADFSLEVNGEQSNHVKILLALD